MALVVVRTGPLLGVSARRAVGTQLYEDSALGPCVHYVRASDVTLCGERIPLIPVGGRKTRPCKRCVQMDPHQALHGVYASRRSFRETLEAEETAELSRKLIDGLSVPDLVSASVLEDIGQAYNDPTR